VTFVISSARVKHTRRSGGGAPRYFIRLYL
jgi:hypothetical protein